MAEPEEYFDETEFLRCPHCDGFGEVPCYCGGDLCVCDNYGHEACPVCGGECEVTEERYERYEANQQRNAEMMRAVWDKIEREKKP